MPGRVETWSFIVGEQYPLGRECDTGISISKDPIWLVWSGARMSSIEKACNQEIQLKFLIFMSASQPVLQPYRPRHELSPNVAQMVRAKELCKRAQPFRYYALSLNLLLGYL